MQPALFLFVGLGNPGERYTHTRHNLGFEVVDLLAERWQLALAHKKFKGHLFEGLVDSTKVLLLKPQTFMNLSGTAVLEAVEFYKLNPEIGLLVISDDLDLPMGRIRLRKAGGSGGHKGLASIIQSLGTESFMRLRIGIGKPVDSPEEFVLLKLKRKEIEEYKMIVHRAAEAVEKVMHEGFERAMNAYNRFEVSDGA